MARLCWRMKNQTMAILDGIRRDRENEAAIDATLDEARHLMDEVFPDAEERADIRYWLNRCLDHIVATLEPWQRVGTTLLYWRDVVRELQQRAEEHARAEAEAGERSMYRDLRPLGI